MLCCGYTLTGFSISIRLTSLALWQSNDCPSASKATLMNMDKYFMWIHYERLHNHNKAKHNKTVCIFLGIYCIWMDTILNLYQTPFICSLLHLMYWGDHCMNFYVATLLFWSFDVDPVKVTTQFTYSNIFCLVFFLCFFQLNVYTNLGALSCHTLYLTKASLQVLLLNWQDHYPGHCLQNFSLIVQQSVCKIQFS